MPIPPFDADGILGIPDHVAQGSGPSLIHCTLQEMHERFVADFAPSPRREAIWAGWMRYRAEFETLGIPYATLVGGSFLTTKAEPADLDLCIIMGSESVGSLGWAGNVKLKQLFDFRIALSLFDCHAHAVMLFPMSDPMFASSMKALSYWTRVFGTDHAGRHRSILIVTERGIHE